MCTFYRLLDLNLGPLIHRATTLPTEPQPLPYWGFFSLLSDRACWINRGPPSSAKVLFYGLTLLNICGQTNEQKERKLVFWNNYYQLGRKSENIERHEIELTWERKLRNVWLTMMSLWVMKMRSYCYCCCHRAPMRPDLAKLCHFGKSLQINQFFTVYFWFGKMLSLIWQICDIIGLIFIVANGQILKNNLTIWSHCRAPREEIIFKEKICGSFRHSPTDWLGGIEHLWKKFVFSISFSFSFILKSVLCSRSTKRDFSSPSALSL